MGKGVDHWITYFKPRCADARALHSARDKASLIARDGARAPKSSPTATSSLVTHVGCVMSFRPSPKSVSLAHSSTASPVFRGVVIRRRRRSHFAAAVCLCGASPNRCSRSFLHRSVTSFEVMGDGDQRRRSQDVGSRRSSAASLGRSRTSVAPLLETVLPPHVRSALLFFQRCPRKTDMCAFELGMRLERLLLASAPHPHQDQTIFYFQYQPRPSF